MNMPIDNNDSIIDILDFEKPPIIIPDKKYIACIGDSITQCYGVIENHDTNTWEYFLNQLLGDEYQVLNYGLIDCFRQISDPDQFMDKIQTENHLRNIACLYRQIHQDRIRTGKSGQKECQWEIDAYGVKAVHQHRNDR